MQRRDPGPEHPFQGATPEPIAHPRTRSAAAPPELDPRNPSAFFRARLNPPPAPAPGPEAPADEVPVLSVAELDRRLKRVVEGATQDVRVEGEIVGLKVHSSGHSYFTLKDGEEEASIDCVMYRAAPIRSRKVLAEGARVVVIGRATVYVPRGKLQLVAEQARPAGRGALLEALERLKQKLASEGLFAPERKQELPADPRVIGVVTSGDGAAIHDIVTVAYRRGSPRILLARAAVQGPGAAQSMVRALELLSRVPEVEVIILGRGGGSAEDLSAYNDEMLVRKVASMPVPVVSAVGHEIDVTLTDLAADARAATPSQAAEMLVPDQSARRQALAHLGTRLSRAMRQAVAERQAELGRLEVALGSPEGLIAERQQQIDEAEARMRVLLERALTRRKGDLGRLERRLAARHPSAVIATARGALGPLEVRLGAAAKRRVEAGRSTLGRHAARLGALSPLSVLARGYAIATTSSGRAVRSASEVSVGERIMVRVHQGALVAEVTGAVEELGLSAPPGEGPASGEGGDG
ncbi:exodeoxyribonuclease VII large subunit [Polyangium aurulentum]|uniref:exodeoxyribonuclease VII large subunit n=1 Tax=Polyangium aurulentum TaxID=2567896 RepID=UPI001F22837B|nr:exodeoxyribonuclease VII large subunit [Polyangium aurulentum]